MRLSVAVCTFNPSRQLLDRVLDRVTDQIGRCEGAELVIVDSKSDPPLDPSLYEQRFGARVVRESRPGLTAAREAAVRDARGEAVLFVDDDNVLAENYVATVLEELDSDPELGLLGGSVTPEYEEKPPRWLAPFEGQLAVRRYPPAFRARTTSGPYSEAFPVGAGFAVRRELALGYFEDAARTTRIEGRLQSSLLAGEDLDLGLYVLSVGRPLVVTGRLRAIHVIPPRRVTPDYIKALSIGSVRSAAELERKWAARLGSPVFEMFQIPLGELLVKAAVAGALSPFSVVHRLKYAFFKELVRIRLRRL
jgi:glycosyltransferase involved in cell wall biosynthesis